MNRRDFIAKSVLATAGLSAGASLAARPAESDAAVRQDGLCVPDGNLFAGMAGAYSAMYTPFFRDGEKEGELNEEMIERLVEYGVKKGLTGMYLTGSTGEGFLLSLDERKRVYSRVAKAARGRLKLIAHVGCISTDDACELARHAAKVGVDWVSSVAPVYFGQNSDAAYAHYKKISEATDLPFMIYSIGQEIVPDRDVKLFGLKNVMGMKYTGYAYWTVKSLRRRLPKPAIFFAGADEQELCAFAYGDTFSGCIGTTDNVIPAHHVQICRLAAAGRFAEAAKLQDDVVRLVELLADATNESCWKSAMRYIGLDCGQFRHPHEPYTESEYADFCAKADALGLFRRNQAI